MKVHISVWTIRDYTKIRSSYLLDSGDTFLPLIIIGMEYNNKCIWTIVHRYGIMMFYTSQNYYTCTPNFLKAILQVWIYKLLYNLIVSGVLNNYDYRWMVMLDFIYMGSAVLFGTGRERKIQNEIICFQRDSNPYHATPRHESQRLRPLDHAG